jgi:membrane-bound lytic murein transglycosylase D
MMKKINSKILLVIFSFSFLMMLVQGCSSTAHLSMESKDTYLNHEKRLLFEQPITGFKPSEDWLQARKTQKDFQTASYNTQQALADSFLVKQARVKLLYTQANNIIQNNRTQNTIPLSEVLLQEAISILSELLSHPEFEPDSEFSELSLFVLQSYDRHIKRLQTLDSDNPAFSIYERLFGNSETIEINENLFMGFVLPKTEMPLVLTPEVKKFVTFYSTRFHDIFQRYLNRAEIYFPMMEPIIASENIPKELIYLSIVESGVNPKAKSRASAVGIWQFIKTTGRMYGLYNNHWFDERQNIEKSTRSAARHLRDLYRRYGDWYLALAAYNAGSGKVNRAIRKAKSRSFWKIRPYLRRETREYVPRFLAATILATYPERFGFKPLNKKPVLITQQVPTTGCVPLSYIAEKSESSLTRLKFLNPELLQGVTPPAYPDYKLIVPEEHAESIALILEELPEEQKLHFKIHKVRDRYDYISNIAEKYGLEAATLKKINGIRNNVIPKGKVMMIPTSPKLETLKSYSKAQLSDDSRLRRRWQRQRYAQKRVSTRILVQAYKEAQAQFLSEIN